MTGTFLVILATFLWALDALIRFPLMEAGFSAVQIVFTEHLILTFIIFGWLKATGQRLWVFKKSDWFALLVIGGLGSAIGTLAFTKAFSLMNPTLVILLQKLQPVVAISLAALVLKERIKFGFILCVVLAFAGSALIIFDDVKNLLDAEGWHYSPEIRDRLMGYGLALTAVVGWGASTVFGKRLTLSGHSSSHIMSGRFAVGLVFLLPILLMNLPAEQAITVNAVSKITLMVLMSGLLGMLLYYQGLQRIASRHSALAEMSFPVMAGLINWVVLGFVLTPLQLLGGVLLISASFAVHLEKPSNGEAQVPEFVPES